MLMRSLRRWYDMVLGDSFDMLVYVSACLFIVSFCDNTVDPTLKVHEFSMLSICS